MQYVSSEREVRVEFMRNFNQKSVTVAVLATCFHLAGCGTGGSTDQDAIRIVDASPEQLAFPAPQNGQAPYGSLNGLSSSAISGIIGDYSGTLVRKDFVTGETIASQPYSLNISKAQVQGYPDTQYAYMTLVSSGPMGEIRIESFLGLRLGLSDLNGVTYYNLISTGLTSAALSDDAFAVELMIALNQNSQFNPTWSSITLLDCGFSQVVANQPIWICSSPSVDSGFSDDLGKH